MTISKRTIKRTIFNVDEYYLYHIFGKDTDNQDYIITNNNFDYLVEYIDAFIDEYGENPNILKLLSMIEKELHKVAEVQVVME
jgi:hypothetical protein